MRKETGGIHHITAIVGQPQENVDFYAGVLGLRLVKRTVNFDDPGTYHLYFGNESGHPGTIMTFFPWPDARKGRIGAGQMGVTTFAVPEGSLDFWQDRLKAFGVSVMKATRFGEEFLQFDDPHGLKLELVARRKGANSRWSGGGIPEEMAIKGFGGGILYSGLPEKTMDFLENGLGLSRVGEESGYVRFRSKDTLGNIVDVLKTPPQDGYMGAGTVHHIAWRAKDDEDQLEWRTHVAQYGFQPTPVKDRQYFKSIYFREQGGILFEIATDPPGFERDEPKEALGSSLKLPPWLEPHRDKIENLLPAVDVRKREGDGE
ncbi:glyoxalase family protein [Melghirimyces profundicolus]|uniref:Glyoxalase family protein n=1 Tax=Melghirimyces profundicolus TaxID=1242148 RepID=A0A2T6BTI3_9BACL|nr:ring-cleaving dioxygenase [Melghirimyces profundicolus]PTX59398.1 glyoxalase family protein [Melghirimyces profundicolus]